MLTSDGIVHTSCDYTRAHLTGFSDDLWCYCGLMLGSGVWSSGTAQSLVTSLEREVLRAEEDLGDCIRVDESVRVVVRMIAFLLSLREAFVSHSMFFDYDFHSPT